MDEVNIVTESETSIQPSEVDLIDAINELDISDESNLITVLQSVQERFGYLPRLALEEISGRTGVALSRIYGVVSFYAQFYTEPRGKHTVRCCCGTACHVKGSPRVLDSVSRVLGISPGESTKDLKFYLEIVACLGTCFLAPAMMIDNQYYGKLTSKRVERILRSYGAEKCRND